MHSRFGIFCTIFFALFLRREHPPARFCHSPAGVFGRMAVIPENV